MFQQLIRNEAGEPLGIEYSYGDEPSYPYADDEFHDYSDEVTDPNFFNPPTATCITCGLVVEYYRCDESDLNAEHDNSHAPEWFVWGLPLAEYLDID